jgi:hypothetical protein
MKALSRSMSILICTAGSVSCSQSENTPLPTLASPAVINAVSGGVWMGVDTTNGGQLVLTVTENGSFRYVDQAGNQGAGILIVNNGNDVSSNFQKVTKIGITFPDGTTLADCTLSGTIAERRTMDVAINCTTTSGPLNQINADLTYDDIYDRNSSLNMIAGTYDDGSGIVTSIASDGTIFEQDPIFGCVANGLVSIIDSDFNAYDYQFDISNCTGQLANLNGASFIGMASLDDTFGRDTLKVAATGVVDGISVSIIIVAIKL